MLRLFILSAIVFSCAALPLTSSNPASLHLLQSPSARCLDATQAGYATAPFLHYIFVTFGQLLPPPRGIHQLNLGIQPRRRRRVRVPARLHKPRQNASRQQQVVAAHHRVGAGTPRVLFATVFQFTFRNCSISPPILYGILGFTARITCL